MKNLYLQCITDGLKYKSQGDNCHIHGFCVMDNHIHLSITYYNGSFNLSNFMRYSQGLFGARFNRRFRRSGAVTEGRPKTPRVQNDYHAMRLQFYIEANPIRAGVETIETLKNYEYSSYGFYAYGIKTRFTHLLTTPQWYTNLGKTNKQRQKKYRKLFRAYLADSTKEETSFYFKRGIGDSIWLEEFITAINDRLNKAKISFETTQHRINFPPDTG